MVPPAKAVADFRQAVIGQFFGEGHGDLPRTGDRTTAPTRHQVGHFYLVVLRNGALDIIKTDLLVLQCQQVLEAVLDQLHIDRLADEVCARYHSLQSAFELTYV